MNASCQRPVALVLLAAAIVVGPAARAAVRTLNIDFGNAGAYQGDDGILSSPGGTHWNEVTITSFPPGSGISTQFHVPALRDEFGQPLPARLANGSFSDAHQVTAPASAPLNDGVHITSSNFFGIAISDLTSAAPIDLAIYFNDPDPNPNVPKPSTFISVNSIFGGGFTDAVFLASNVFPGQERRDHLRFSNLSPIATTLGDPPHPGITINVSMDSVANIAALQIRGEFVPEPSALLIGLVACSCASLLRRKRRR
jgi:hypothetical protein